MQKRWIDCFACTKNALNFFICVNLCNLWIILASPYTSSVPKGIAQAVAQEVEGEQGQ